MKKTIALALFTISLITHVYFGYFTNHTMGATGDSFSASAEYECQMLMAETTDWDEADIIEACQP